MASDFSSFLTVASVFYLSRSFSLSFSLSLSLLGVASHFCLSCAWRQVLFAVWRHVVFCVAAGVCLCRVWRQAFMWISMGWTLWLVTPYGRLVLGLRGLFWFCLGSIAGMCAYMDILVFLFFATMVCDWFVVAWVTELFNQKACRPGWVKRLCPWHRFGIAQRMAKHVFKNKSVASLLGRSNGDEMFWFWLNVKARMRVK